jgi:hypothetical protein
MAEPLVGQPAPAWLLWCSPMCDEKRGKHNSMRKVPVWCSCDRHALRRCVVADLAVNTVVYTAYLLFVL